MPNAIYQYVYLEPLALNGPYTRQNRNPATSPMYAPVPQGPWITVPPTNDLATGSTFTVEVPKQTFTDGDGNVYTFGFMNVSGCVGAGETSTDYNSLPGSASFAPLIVGTQVINVFVLYINNGVPGPPPGGGGASIYLDAFDETTGTFLNNFFVANISPDNGLTSNVNVYGSLAVEQQTETVTAAPNPVNTPGVPNSLANFDKWVQLEGTASNPVINGNSLNLVVDGSTSSDIVAFAFYQDPASIYITGSYQSPDIILFTPFSTTSLGAELPIGNGDTIVSAGVQYGFAAVVHNGSNFEVSTKVTFWNIPKGLGTLGILLDTQTVTIPANSSATVISSQPFVNTGGADYHTCAAVSLYAPDSLCQFNPTSSADAQYIPNPDANVSHSTSAWRNTSTIVASPGHPWQLNVGLGELLAGFEDGPVGIQLKTQYVPADFAQNDRVLEVIREHGRIYGKTPPYLIPVLRKELSSADVKPALKLISEGRLSAEQGGNGYLLHFKNNKETDFKVSGVVPETAKPGDTYLLDITAHYPKTGRSAAKTIGFLAILLVKDK